ncbi:hypothetical protein [Neisseria basseii]|uniref:hypothetical protein n=1 Tax=Neisseria basseii TaxID=2830650 RepID=UPI002659497B|nr:hypothetical protein [Neisseria basseii]
MFFISANKSAAARAKPAPNAAGKYAYRWETQPHPPPGVSDGTTAVGNVRRLRQRRTQKTVRLRLQQSDRYRRRAFAVFSKPFASSTRPPRDAAATI